MLHWSGSGPSLRKSCSRSRRVRLRWRICTIIAKLRFPRDEI